MTATVSGRGLRTAWGPIHYGASRTHCCDYIMSSVRASRLLPGPMQATVFDLHTGEWLGSWFLKKISLLVNVLRTTGLPEETTLDQNLLGWDMKKGHFCGCPPTSPKVPTSLRLFHTGSKAFDLPYFTSVS